MNVNVCFFAFWRTGLLVFCAGFFLGILPAQTREMIGPPEGLRAPRRSFPPRASRDCGDKDTLPIRADQPFFDDFSSGRFPDSSRWDYSADEGRRVPLLNAGIGINPPSLGACVFDGATSAYKPYFNTFSQGPTDRLESHYLDLSELEPTDDVWLSFFVQAQGHGHPPGQNDSFLVYVNGRNRGCDSLIKVYARAGTGRAEPFRQVHIPLRSSIFFHERFYLAFESVGYQNGLLNEWVLDYVTLAPNRSADDTTYSDASVTGLSRSPFHPYTAIPYQQYAPRQYARPFDAELSNLRDNSLTASVRGDLREVLTTPLLPGGYRQTESNSLSPYANSRIPFSAYDDSQPLVPPDSARFIHRVAITQPSDPHPENDTFHHLIRIDSIYAYDDGQPEVGYGLNTDRGFGLRFDLSEPDSLLAVWLCFAPSIDFLIGGSLEGRRFYLTVWDADHPDSIRYREFSSTRVRYPDPDSSQDCFMRYTLSEPVSLSGTVYIGLAQLENGSINLGMDRTYDNRERLFYDSAGVWRPSRIRGTPMIRPEFRNIRFNPGPIVIVSHEPRRITPGWKVWISARGLEVACANFRNAHWVRLSVYDLTGKLQIGKIDRPGSQDALYLNTESLAPGVYLLRGETSQGERFAQKIRL